jgi:hypothetical protein
MVKKVPTAIFIQMFPTIKFEIKYFLLINSEFSIYFNFIQNI